MWLWIKAVRSERRGYRKAIAFGFVVFPNFHMVDKLKLNKACALRKKGYSWRSIADTLGTTIYKLRKEWDAQRLPGDTGYRSRQRKSISALQASKARELRLQGVSWAKISRLLRIKQSTLKDALYSKHIDPTKEVLEAIKLRNLGLRWKEIGRSTGSDAMPLRAKVQRYLRSIRS